jgi:predicted ATPase/DNA-binding SARP family transcriptional activator/tetratricopeptide (TPR) repeat protein
VEFRVLGTLEVLDTGGHPVELRGTKLRTLLAALILRAGQQVSADRLVDVLWGDRPPRGAANALQAQISKLRRALGDVPIEGRDGGYVLSIDPSQIDAERFVELATLGHDRLDAGQHAEAAASLGEALSLWRGPALADFAFDEFAQAHRTRLDEMRLTATEDRIDADLACGRHEAVAAELEGLVHEHGLRERLWGQLMVALYRCGRQTDSLRAFQRARTLLADELGLEPGHALRELEQQVLAHDPALDVPASVTNVPRRLTNIRPELSTFVGRSTDVAQIAELLQHRRLVTLTGPGGVGKTRIATEIALQFDGTYRDGTWLVELGLENGQRAVHAALLRTFGPRLGHTGGDPTIDWLTDGLATNELLIVLDNCEHVLAEAAAAASAIVRSCPRVAVLATSREPLGVAGERVRALQPLELDDAVQLFASRAADSASDFVLDDGSAAAVATICSNVDRLPLAIELTAARTRAFSARQLADLLDHRFGVVSAGTGGRPRRQQTMHAAVDWSFDLLFDDERRLLTRLSVFAGGFTLSAAVKVCADDSLPADDIEVLLARLVDKSLVSVQARSAPARSGPERADDARADTRFRLLRPVAEYSAMRLEEANETALIRDRHSHWLVALTDGLTRGLRGPHRYEWAHLANAELDNLTRAATWGLGDGDPAVALQIGVNLGWYAFVSANVQSDEPVLMELLDRCTDAPPALRCRALMWSGLLTIGRTVRRTWAMDAVDVARTAVNAGTAVPTLTVNEGMTMSTDAIALARAMDDPLLLLETLEIGSLHMAAVGLHPDVLSALIDEVSVLAASSADPWHIAMAAALTGLATYVTGDLDTSMLQLRGAIDAFRMLDDDGTAALFEVSFSEVAELRGDIAGATSAMAVALAVGSKAGFRSSTILRAVLCWLSGRNGQVGRALELGREVVELAREPFNPVIRAQALFALGVAETLAGLTDESAEHLGEALEIHRRVGMTREAAMDHRHLGHLRHLQGDVADAIEHHRQAVLLAMQVGLPWTVVLTARSLAAALVDDDAALAAQLLGNTEALSDIFGYPPTDDERELVATTLATATAKIGAVAVGQAGEAGAELSFAQLEALLGPLADRRPNAT